MSRCKTEFRRMLQSADATHRHCLRKAADVMEHEHLDERMLLRMSTAEIERVLRKLGVKNADAIARRLPGAINHLAGKFPDAGLPITPASGKGNLVLGCRRDLPRQLRLEMVAVWRMSKSLRLTDPEAAIAPITLWTTLRSCREFEAAAVRSGVELEDDCGFEALSY